VIHLPQTSRSANIQEHYFVFYRPKRATDYEKADLILDFDEMMKNGTQILVRLRKTGFYWN